ncbi:hypothetical protein EXN66_Car003927 [Channa argus]|uniref:SPRY-associated domain-containing protein n=1 Tax=Channa argus TaxID=215402 RepID=A0A6G1PDB8_CHAAH|nr:hypothetical protein EXN66_Car003927 [Channa argus]
MDQCQDREEGVPPSKTTLCGEPESQTKAQRPEKLHGPESAGPEPGPEPSCVSTKSDQSMDIITGFKYSSDTEVDQQSSQVPSGQSAQQHQTHLDSIFMLLEDNIVTVVKNEIKQMKKILTSDSPDYLESQRKDEKLLDDEDEEQRSSRESFPLLLSPPLSWLTVCRETVRLSDLRGRLCFSGRSSELQPLPSERTGPELQSSRRLRSDTLRVEPAGERWLRPGLRKYFCQLTIDTNTVNRKLQLSDNNRKVTHVKEDHSYPDYQDRFDWCVVLV